MPPAPYALVPVKFVGGILAIGSGLALGREGPSVQMGAGVATFVGRLFRRGFPDSRVLIAAGAGAGLATAFNAPLAGAVFVLEELVAGATSRGSPSPRWAPRSLRSPSPRQILGNAPDFFSAPIAYPPLGAGLFLVFGLFAGALAVAYNLTILGALSVGDRLARIPVEVRAAAIGAAVATLALVSSRSGRRRRPHHAAVLLGAVAVGATAGRVCRPLRPGRGLLCRHDAGRACSRRC